MSSPVKMLFWTFVTVTEDSTSLFTAHAYSTEKKDEITAL